MKRNVFISVTLIACVVGLVLLVPVQKASAQDCKDEGC